MTRTRGRRLFDANAKLVWAITEEYVDRLTAIYDAWLERKADGRPLDLETLAKSTGKEMPYSRATTVRDGVAVIPIDGPIFKRANLMTEYSGAVSSEVLMQDLQRALDDRSVRSILLDVDSPGGEAQGINELANFIRAATEQKPIEAYAGGDACSGAYWLASATNRITADGLASLGSIGCVGVYHVEDTRGRVKLRSTQSPLKQAEPTNDEGLAHLQSQVDDIAQVFINSVARFRGRTAEEVQERFGRGGVLIGERALAAGLADEMGSFEDVLARMAAGDFRQAPEGVTGVDAGRPVIRLETDTPLFEYQKAVRTAPAVSKVEDVMSEKKEGAEGTIAPNQLAVLQSQELATLREQNEKLTANQAATEAKLFVAENKGKIVPGQEQHIVTAYTAAYLDDMKSPLAGGAKRTDALRGVITHAQPHKLTGETVGDEELYLVGSEVPTEDPVDAEAKAGQEDARRHLRQQARA